MPSLSSILGFFNPIIPWLKEAAKTVGLFFAGAEWKEIMMELQGEKTRNAALKSKIKIDAEVNAGGTPERVRRFYVDKPKSE